MVREIILERGTNNIFWPKIVLTMTHIKNLRPIQAFKKFISTIKMQNQAATDIHHLHIFSFNVYVFLYKKEQSLKSAKWEACALKG